MENLNKKKGQALNAMGNVSHDENGYQVKDAKVKGVAKINYVTKNESNQVICSCDDFNEFIQQDDTYTCVHIEAVRFYAVNLKAKQDQQKVNQSSKEVKQEVKTMTDTNNQAQEIEKTDKPKYFTQGFKRPIQDIMQDLHKPIAERHLKTRRQGGKEITYIAWYDACKYLDMYAIGWYHEIRNIQQIAGKVVITVRITIQALEGEFYREATGNEDEDMDTYGDAFSNSESQALRRCCAKFGLGQHLYRDK